MPFPLVYHASLQKRIVRLQSILKFEKDDRRSFPPGTKTKHRYFTGVRLDEPVIGQKSAWALDLEEDEEGEGTVEDFALQEYRKLGWKGLVHFAHILIPSGVLTSPMLSASRLREFTLL